MLENKVLATISKYKMIENNNFYKFVKVFNID